MNSYGKDLGNPHNPGGVVWTEAELRAIADICYDEKVLVFSDEIHADLTLPPHTHRPFATVSEKARMNSVTFMSPSKAFNMPGLSASHALIFNEDLKILEAVLFQNRLELRHASFVVFKQSHFSIRYTRLPVYSDLCCGSQT